MEGFLLHRYSSYPTVLIFILIIFTMNSKASISQHILSKPHLKDTMKYSHAYTASPHAYPRLPQCRYASASATKPIRLEKPTKFVPPSHGKRLKQHIPRHYGPGLTQVQKKEQATKKYPNMMPPEGTFMYWFLTNRGIHSFISLVGLQRSLHEPFSPYYVRG